MRNYLHQLIEAFHASNPENLTSPQRLPEIMDIAIVRAMYTGRRQRLIWNQQFKSWEVVTLYGQPLPSLTPRI